MPEFKELCADEWEAFLAKCWERNEVPADEAWKRHLQWTAYDYLRRAHRALRFALAESGVEDPHDDASDRLITCLRRDPVWHIAGSGMPSLDEFDLEEIGRAWTARREALRTMPYAAYLETPEWGEQRRGALRRSDHACETCGGNGRLHVHHRTYERRGEERADDLIVLCEDCHLAVHTNGGSHRPQGLRRAGPRPS